MHTVGTASFVRDVWVTEKVKRDVIKRRIFTFELELACTFLLAFISVVVIFIFHILALDEKMLRIFCFTFFLKSYCKPASVKKKGVFHPVGNDFIWSWANN